MEPAMGESDAWCTIESDPGVFQAICDEMGVKGIQFEEIFTLGPEAFLDLAQPVYGLIFLFKWRSEKTDEAMVEAADPSIFFANQVIPNACATQAILSILLNSEADIGPHLKEFKEFTSGFDAQMRGLCLSNSEVVRAAHNSFRAPIDNMDREKDKDKEKDDAFHFVGYIRSKGKLYELDGLKPGPLLIAEVGDNNSAWLEVARNNIQKRIDSYTHATEKEQAEGAQVELRFNLMAIVGDKLSKAEKDLEWQRFLRQRANVSLLSRGEELELEDEIDEDLCPDDVPSFEELSEQEIPKLHETVKKCNGEIHRLNGVVASEKQIREQWKKENEKRKTAALEQAQKMEQMQAMEQMQMLQSLQASQQNAGSVASQPAAAPASGGAPAATPAAATTATADAGKATGSGSDKPRTALASEAENTDKMRQHQMTKKQVVATSMKHEDVDLMVSADIIDKSSRTSALNAAEGYATLFEVLGANPEEKAMVSDVDPQLLLKVNFKEKANLSQIVLRFGKEPTLKEEDSDEILAKPRLVKVFTNMDDMDFGDTESTSATATVTVEDSDASEVKIACIGHKFQRLHSLQILVDEAQDPEATRTYINRVSLTGHEAASYHAEYK